MYCISCGTQLPDKARFCGRCGTPRVPGTAGTTETAEAAEVTGTTEIGGETKATAPYPDAGRYASGAPGPRFGTEPQIAPSAAVEQIAGPVGAIVERPRGATLRTAGGDFELAGFGIRLGGAMIDAVIVLVFLAVAGLISDGIATEESEEALGLVVLVVPLIAWWAFNTVGWSPGQRAVGLRIIQDDGARPGLGYGFARTVGMPLSLAVVLLGFLWAAWDDRRQTWHDKISGTFVVRS